MTRMINHCAVILLTGSDTPAHLEKHHCISSMCHCLIAPQTHNARSFERTVWVPVSHTGSLLHQPECLSMFESSHHIMAHGNLCRRRPELRIVVPTDEIHFLAPLLIIKRLVKAHKIRCNRNIRSHFFDRISLQFKAFQNTV